MPKSQLAIKRFEGGLHTNADPRDIADNEFSALEGFDVDSLGRIVMMGGHDNHTIITAKETDFKAGATVWSTVFLLFSTSNLCGNCSLS